MEGVTRYEIAASGQQSGCAGGAKCLARHGMGASRLADLWRQCLEPAVVGPEADQHAQRQPAGSPDGVSDRRQPAGVVRDHADRRREHDVRDHGLQRSHDRVRSEQQEAGLALRAQARHDSHLLRAQQPRGGGQRRVGIRGYVGRAPHRARCEDRQGQVGRRGGGPHRGVQHHPCPADRRPERDRRGVRRRIRHPGTRHGLQREDGRAGLALVLDSRPEGRPDVRRQGAERLVGHLGDEGRGQATCIATSPRRRPTAPSTAMPGRPAAAACG